MRSIYWPQNRPPVLLHRHTGRGVAVLDEEDQDLCRFRVTGVVRDGVDIVRVFIEGLSCREGLRLAALYLHHDGTFQYVNESMGVVAVRGGHFPGRKFHGQQLPGLARRVRMGSDQSRLMQSFEY